MNNSIIKTSAGFLRTIPAVRTNTYTPIPHSKIIDETLNLFQKHNLTVRSEEYTMCSEGKIAQGNYSLATQDTDMCLMLAWQNSTNKQVSFKYAVGSKVFVCSNGCVNGDLGAYKRIHKGLADVEAYNKMELFIERMEESFQEMVTIKERMKQIEMGKSATAELVGKLWLEEEILSITQLGIIKKEIEDPSFDYGVEGSLWNVYQHCTHSFKEIGPRTWLPKQVELSKYLTQEYGLITV